jgi:hypothetical protein
MSRFAAVLRVSNQEAVMTRQSMFTAAIALSAVIAVVGCGKSPLNPGQVPDRVVDHSGSLSLVGQVQSEEGAVLSGVTVTAARDGFSRSAQTDETGAFVIENIDAGDWMVSFARDGFSGSSQLVLVGETGATITFMMTPDDAQLFAPRVVSRRVRIR